MSLLSFIFELLVGPSILNCKPAHSKAETVMFKTFLLIPANILLCLPTTRRHVDVRKDMLMCLNSLCALQEVVTLYFDDSAQKLQKLTVKLGSSPPEFGEVDALVHQFKGSSASFGAHALAMLCVQVKRPFCPESYHRQDILPTQVVRLVTSEDVCVKMNRAALPLQRLYELNFA